MSTEPHREPALNKLFRMVRKYEAFVLYLKVGEPPMLRLRGDIQRADMRPLTQEDMERLLFPLITDQQRQELDETGMVSFPHTVGTDEGGFACFVSRKQGRLGLSACLLEGN